ncbi:MAG: hypothetical protein IJI78_04975 [Oscillospiraceae bacterium]|nr:hypothetical protein [Oscillospiraceae bacterium]
MLCCTASVGEYAYTRVPLPTNQQFNAFVTKLEFDDAVFHLYVFEFAKTLPLAEQKHIVAQLEELLPLCERLK